MRGDATPCEVIPVRYIRGRHPELVKHTAAAEAAEKAVAARKMAEKATLATR